MGCCVSTSSPYPTHEPSSSSRAITSTQSQSHAALPRPSTHASTHSNRPITEQPQPLDIRPSKPLRLHVWTSTSRTWTRAELDRERIEFFETRVTGRPEIWLTIQAALQVLWQGNEEGEADGGLGTAQMMFEAAGITLPTGDLANGVYDGSGERYNMPEHIVADPENLVVASQTQSRSDDGTDKSGPEELNEDEVLRRREEKGKEVVNPQDLIKVRARLSDGRGQDMVLVIGKNDSVRLLTRRILEDGLFPPGRSIKIAYMGKILEGNRSLISQGWKEGHVVNAMVFG
ncbi:Ubiquitin domain-containing protein 2 [Phlyctema vagabunda]|uniref:Ubiquitin domain-containing protein 2 n=1 Tax=Phlyctema vagabunda TaxID=108571 RepID=A0ABR4PBW1_9HELO